MDKKYTFKTVKEMDLEASREAGPEQDTLESLFAELVDVLERIDKIRPVQFLDFESEYVYNFLRIRESPTDDRVYIEVSGCYDNLPAHCDLPLRDSRGGKLLPHSTCRGVARDD